MPGRRRILILASDPTSALHGRGVLQASGHDVTTISSLTEMQGHFFLRQFEAVIVVNSFNEPGTVLSGLAEILDEQDTIPGYINS